MGSQEHDRADDRRGDDETPKQDDELTMSELDQVAGGSDECTCTYVYGEKGWFRREDSYCPRHGRRP